MRIESNLRTPDKPAVSVVVPCRNEVHHIEACLRSILQQGSPPGGLEVVVADGMSDDGTRDFLDHLSRRDPRVRVIDNPKRIVSAGLNLAIRAAKADIIIRLDAHTEYAPDYVRECVAASQVTGADNLGGPARTKAVTFTEQAVAAAYHSPFAVGGARFHNVNYEGYVDTVTYGCWHKEVFERFGYFDEELVRNQDDEHNLRICRGGGKIWQSPRIRSWYRPRGSLGALFNQYMQYGYWKVRVIQKHRLPASWRHLVPGTFLLTLFLLFATSGLCLLTSSFWSLGSLIGGLTFWLLLAILGLYVLCVLAASVLAATKTKWILLPLLPVVFACYHFGYAYGFLRGIWDFVIRRKRPGRQFVQLTRTAAQAESTRG